MKVFEKIFKVCLTAGFIFFGLEVFYAQDQDISDSLKVIFKKDTATGYYKLDLLVQLSFNEKNDMKLALNYTDLLIAESIEQKNNEFLFHGYNLNGSTNRLLGNLDAALSSFLKASETAISSGNKVNEGGAYISIGDVYSEMGNSGNAELYYNKAIDILRETDDTIYLATALINAGDEALKTDKYDKALAYFKESGQLFKKVDYLVGTAYNLGNIGMVYAGQNKNILAEKNIEQAITILEEFEDYSAIAEYLTYMSDIYEDKEDFATALNYAHSSLKIAKENDLKKQISESNLRLYEIHKANTKTDSALYYFQNHIIYRDSIRNLEAVEKMAFDNIKFSDAQAEKEKLAAKIAEARNRTQLIILGFIGAILIALTFFFVAIKKEKNKSDALLLNILPEETATELKKEGKVKAKQYESVSVLFTDFKGFTSYSEKLSPEELVKTVGYYFSKFDEIIEKYNLEKIKTIGDAYMCAGGIHSLKDNHARQVIAAALDIAAFVEQTKKNAASDELNFDIRLGINTGPVVAGVVGTKKFAYDIWGDTVNVASRMESHGEVGRVNISENTYHLVKKEFSFEYRGELEVKNRGQLKMYLVQ